MNQVCEELNKRAEAIRRDYYELLRIQRRVAMRLDQVKRDIQILNGVLEVEGLTPVQITDDHESTRAPLPQELTER